MNTVINIRIDKKTKEQAQKVFRTIGIDMSAGLKMFLNQVIKDQCFPFVPTTKKTIALRKVWDREVREALKGKGYASAKEMFDDLEKDV